MRKLLVIGIGAGDPRHVTIEAVGALNEADVFFVPDKGREKGDLLALRREICDRYIERPTYRFVEVADPERDRTAPAYRAAVEDWRRRRAEAFERVIQHELGEGGCGAFLVWGDPAFYDSTIAMIDEIVARGSVALRVEVIPGISSIQTLAARHGIGITQVGRAVHITTGRLLAGGFPDGVDDVVVMLDADCAFRTLGDDDIHIYWGAYLGTEDEILVSGDVHSVAHEIVRVRAEARMRKGWIMDTYLLRRAAR